MIDESINTAHISLGSNLGDRLSLLQRALQEISLICKVVKISSVYETDAWGVLDQDKFLNQVLIIETTSDPHELLADLQAIEEKLGKQQAFKWGPRSIDIDILYFADRILNANDLILPHPFISERLFILRPLTEIDPEYIHPVLGISNTQILERCKDKLSVGLYSETG